MRYNRKLSRVLVVATGISAAAAVSIWLTRPTYDGVRHLRYSFTVQNTSGEHIGEAEFTTFAPIPSSATQSLSELKSSTPYETEDDPYGNRLMHFKMGKLPPYATKVVVVDAWVKTASKANRGFLDSEKKFLQPENAIEVDSPEIQKQAKNLNNGNDSSTAQATAKWVENNVQYSSPEREPLGALYAIRNRKGDCTEFANLTTALARANKIPARTMTGFITPENAVIKPQQLHNWSEIHTGSRWHLADPQNRRYDTNSDWYIAFRIEGSPNIPKEFVATDNKNLSVKMN